MVSRSQHGWNLGEFDIWCKMTNFELGTRVPLIISAPWLTASKGQRSMALAEAVDLYPTLSELAMGAGQLPTGKAGEYLGGASLAPIFKDISVKVKNVSLSQFSRCECLFPPRLLFSLVWLLARLLQEAYFLQPLSYRNCYQISSSAEKETDRGCLPTLPHGVAWWMGGYRLAEQYRRLQAGSRGSQRQLRLQQQNVEPGRRSHRPAAELLPG